MSFYYDNLNLENIIKKYICLKNQIVKHFYLKFLLTEFYKK